MKTLVRHSFRMLLIALGFATLAACETAPVTGREQFIIVSEDQAQSLGASAYQQIISQSKVSRNSRLQNLVKRVGQRIAAVSDAPGYKWEYVVIEDPAPNAFALPGGKLGVHTGMFDVAKNEAQLAAVIAHEIGHVVARHSAERMSRQLAVEGGLTAAGMTSATIARNARALSQIATLGLILPFSRNQEAEADAIGLTYMARAGYNPRAAIALWKNFAEYGGQRPPEFLSTHPSPGNRIARLEAQMPRAMEIYQTARSR